jgi:4-hydroxy-tetrahydrodipicolinate synthase
MASSQPLRGVYVPLVTPFASDGQVALAAMEVLANRYLDAGAAGLTPLGTTGEAPALDGDEQLAIIDLCSRISAERSTQLIVGAGTNSTRTTVTAVKRLSEFPAVTAALCVVPYYVRPSQEGIVEHFKVVAKESPVPIVIYNIPYRTGRVLEADGLLELASTKNIIGLKQAVGGIDTDTMRVLDESPDDFAVLGGEDPYLFPTVLLGGTGAICASAHLCTERFVAMIECGLSGNIEEGRAHQEALAPVIAAGFAEPNPAVFKGVLHAQGLIPTPDLRLPMTPASSSSITRALEAVEAANS